MALYFVTGVMGSGKTLCGAGLILDCLREGGTVHTNIPLRMDEIDAAWASDSAKAGAYWCDRDVVVINELDEEIVEKHYRLTYRQRVVFLPRDIRKLVKRERGAIGKDGVMGEDLLSSDFLVGGEEGSENLVVVDESAILLSADDQAKAGEKDANKPLFELTALCRHVGLDLYFLAQDKGHVNSKLRDLAEYTIKCFKVERIPMAGWLLAMIPGLGQFLRIYYSGKSRAPTGRTWHAFRPEVGAIYDTHGMRGGIAIKTSKRRKKGMEVTQKKGKVVAVMVLALILSLAGYSCVSGRKVYKDLTKGKESPAVAPVPGSPAPGAVAGSLGPAVVASGPASRRRRNSVAEWDPEDERPFCGVVTDSGGVRVHLADGELLAIGRNFEGESLRILTVYAGRYYFRAESGRVFVARPLTGLERLKRYEAGKPDEGFFAGAKKQFTGGAE